MRVVQLFFLVGVAHLSHQVCKDYLSKKKCEERKNMGFCSPSSPGYTLMSAYCPATCGLCDVENPSTASPTVDVQKEFDEFVQTFGKSYATPEEAQRRFGYFKENLAELNELKKIHGDLLGINDLMDWSQEEKDSLSQLKEGPPFDAIPKVNFSEAGASRRRRQAKTSFDWRDTNKVTSVKMQGTCGSCWAYAAVAITESFWAIQKNQHVDLSEQYLVDCDTADNEGCQGGLTPNALDYIVNNGIPTEAQYPYRGANGACNKNIKGSKYIADYLDVGLNEEELPAMLEKYGPMGWFIYVPSSMYYIAKTGGVFNPTPAECEQARDRRHAVTIVGYGVDAKSGLPYWTIKNSYGAGWGQAGYFKLRRGNLACNLHQGAVVATATPICADRAYDPNFCLYYQRKGYCNPSDANHELAKKYCLKTCGLGVCASSTTSGKVPTTTATTKPTSKCTPLQIQTPNGAKPSVEFGMPDDDHPSAFYKCDTTPEFAKVCLKVTIADAVTGQPRNSLEFCKNKTFGLGLGCFDGKWQSGSSQQGEVIAISCTQSEPIVPTPAPPAPTPVPTTTTTTSGCPSCPQLQVANPNNAKFSVTPAGPFGCGTKVNYRCDKTGGFEKVCMVVMTMDSTGKLGGFGECFPNYVMQDITCNQGKWMNISTQITSISCTQQKLNKCTPPYVSTPTNIPLTSTPNKQSYDSGEKARFQCSRPASIPAGQKKICVLETYIDDKGKLQKSSICFQNHLWFDVQCNDGVWEDFNSGIKMKSIQCYLQ